MIDSPTPAQPTTGALWRWLVGGLVAGGVVLGLLIGAYAIGYHHGKDQGQSATAAPPAAASTTTTTATAPPASAQAIGAVAVTPALVAQGKTLYQADGCAACHSLSGAAGVGPSLNGIAGTSVALANGQTVKADDTYLEQSITDPDADIAKGYRAGVMTAAVGTLGLTSKPAEIRALVAFIKSQH